MKNAKEILDFYILSGITDITSDTPFGLKKTNNTGVDSIESAKQISLKAQNIDELLKSIKEFNNCALKQTSSHTILGTGNQSAQYMIIIDAPGDDDERSGKILSGKSGEFIKNFLKALKIQENECFFSPLLPWRPPGNRAPTQLEADTCWPFLEKQISLISPKKIFVFGIEPAQILSKTKKTINQLRENKIIYQTTTGTNIEIIPSLSINYMMFNPIQKAKLWDFLIKCD
ncbi:MAG: uracil-DNA glycosylase [Alphaproteobacteria bacterium]